MLQQEPSLLSQSMINLKVGKITFHMPKIPLGMCSWHAEYTNRPQEYCIAAEFQTLCNVLKIHIRDKAIFGAE